MLPPGAPITLPAEELAPRPSVVAGIEWAIAQSVAREPSLDPKSLGELRSNLLFELSKLPENDGALDDSKAEAIASCALLAWQTAGSLAVARPKPILMWNEELDPTSFIGRTILMADHVLWPDPLLAAINSRPSNRHLREIAIRELRHDALTRSGRILAVPSGAALAAALATQKSHSWIVDDLANPRLVEFVRAQLVVEGPTAREAIFVSAIDELKPSEMMWLHAHIVAVGDESDPKFTSRLLGPYDPAFDYGPWVEQVTRDAVTTYIQRTAERLQIADLFGAEFVASSPFEARLLERRDPAYSHGPGSASMWADIPTLRRLDSKELAQVLEQDEAVEDLRDRIRSAIAAAPTLASQTEAIKHTVAEIERSSHTLERKIRTERTYAAIAPGVVSLAAVVIGAAGGLPGIAAGALSGIAGVLPYVASRKDNRRQASYLYVTARRTQSNRKRSGAF